MQGQWVIRNLEGDQLLSFKVNPQTIELGWFRPGAPGKTREGRDGPLTFATAAEAQAVLTGLAVLVPKQLTGAGVTELIT